MLGFPILYCKGMRPMMFQLSGFCYAALRFSASALSLEGRLGYLGFRV